MIVGQLIDEKIEQEWGKKVGLSRNWTQLIDFISFCKK
jgi:hypothetical protein